MPERGDLERAEAAERLATEAVAWMVAEEQDADDPSLYQGRAGVLLALLEARAHDGSTRHDAHVERLADALVASVDELEDCSLYLGLAGIAVALRAVGRDEAADRALRHVRARYDGRRWNHMFEVLLGNAGIALGALHAGDTDLAVTAVEAYLDSWDATPGGISWPVRPSPSRSHHLAHGTLGIALALAAVGDAAGRDDLVDLALRGAADVVARDEAGPEGFLVPHSDPQHRPDEVERYSYGWCNGPAGDAQVFRLLAQVTGGSEWTALGDRCWATVLASGVPRRLRPGFWDNSGRCCGTAGVLALACDRVVERGDELGFADVLVDDLAARATLDRTGARWSNVEHRADHPLLDPLPGWAMGNAGIVRELLRYARLHRGTAPGYAVAWPDHVA